MFLTNHYFFINSRSLISNNLKISLYFKIGGSAQDVTRALTELLNHIKDGHTDKIPDIMEQIMVASGELIASYDSGEMVRQARILAQSTAELIQAIKGEAETQSDSDLQVRIW